MSIVVALTPRLAHRSLGSLRRLLGERGLTVSGDAGLLERAGPAATPSVLAGLLREVRVHDAVVVTTDPSTWSDVLHRFLGADFRLLACTDEPPEQNLDFARTDVVVPVGDDGTPDLRHAVATLAGGTGLRPDRYEHAMFLAEGQSTRSAGMRGGVGCALLDGVGDVIAVGTNEVPRAGGGQYWADSPDDARDLLGGVDPARTSKERLVRAVLEFARPARGEGPDDLASLTARFLDELDSGPSHDGVAQALESLGRVVHAELAAMASAARHGAALTGAQAVVTRPPCRQCLRQLIVTGVSQVRFLGPADAAHYPFHADATTSEDSVPDKVRVIPFSGVTPRGYGKVFQSRGGHPWAVGAALARVAEDAADPLAAVLRTLAEPS